MSANSVDRKGDESIEVPLVASLEAKSFPRKDSRDRDVDSSIETSERSSEL